MPFDMIHVVPPQKAPDCIRVSPLADAAGWADIDPAATRRKRHFNVFAVGGARYSDCVACPLTVARGGMVLAGFLYGGKLAPGFPSWLTDGARPSRPAWLLKGREWMVQPELVDAASTRKAVA